MLNHQLNSRKARNSAFTLIELLIVIAIIAILASILFPVFAQAKAAAKTAVCLSNQKQIAIGCLIYVQDYDDCFPPQSTFLPAPSPTTSAKAYWWYSFSYVTAPPSPNVSFTADGGLLNPYLKNFQVQGCPQGNDLITPISSLNSNAGPILAIGQNLLANAANLSLFTAPSTTILTGDGAAKSGTDLVPSPLGLQQVTSGPTVLDPRTHGRHSGGKANLSWCDGHAKLAQVSYLNYTNQNYIKSNIGWVVQPGVNLTSDPLANCYYQISKLAGCTN